MAPSRQGMEPTITLDQADPTPSTPRVMALADSHARAVGQVAAALGVDPDRGLDAHEASSRADLLGPNALESGQAPSVWRMVRDAATEPFVLLLLVAGLAAIVLGEVRDGILILLGLIPIVGADEVSKLRGERALE